MDNLIKSHENRIHALENKIFVLLLTMIANLGTTLTILIANLTTN